MAISVDEILEISVNGVAAGQACVNVFHYKPSSLGPGFTSTTAQCLDTFRTMWRTAVLPGLSDSYSVLKYTLRSLIGTQVDPGDPNRIILNIGDVGETAGVPATDLGGVAGAPLPTYTAMTIRKLSGVGGKRKKGSCRLGPIAEAFTEATDQNKLTAAAAAAAAVAAAGIKVTLSTAVAGESLVPVILSRATLFPEPPVVVPTMVGTWTSIADCVPNIYVGSQVSRKQRSTFGA